MGTQKNLRVVIVGAGMGGLSAALDLGSRGVAVTLLESHDEVGGKMHQTRINGIEIDSGPTVFTMRHVFDQLFMRAGAQLDERIQLVKLDELARHFWCGSDPLSLYSDVDKTCSAIADFSNVKEADKYRTFAKKSEAIFHALDKSFMQRERPSVLSLGANVGLSQLFHILRSPPFVSLWQSLCWSFDDARLRQLFARYSTYCGSSPFNAPATLMLIAHAERAGVWAIKDGMQSLANALAELVREQGCDVRLNTRVERINCVSGSVNGVTLADGTSISADAVIYNGDLGALHEGWLGESVRHAVPKPAPPSLSAITLACVAQVNSPALSYHNVFFGSDYRDEFDAVFKHQTITNDPTIYVCAPHQTETKVPDASTQQPLFCLMNAPATTYNAQRTREHAQTLENTLNRHGITINAQPDHQVVASPASFAQRFHGSKGALYGAPTHGWTGSFTRSGSTCAIPRLYLAGGGVHPGAGVPMVSLSGQLAAKRILSDFAVI
jgi:1-hydroxycarotenoid 3,4-desaturase